jgi:hypothetical protein
MRWNKAPAVFGRARVRGPRPVCGRGGFVIPDVPSLPIAMSQMIASHVLLLSSQLDRSKKVNDHIRGFIQSLAEYINL